MPGGSARRQGGMLIVLVLAILMVIAILGVAYKEIAGGVRRDLEFSLYRLVTARAARNCVQETLPTFLALVNFHEIRYTPPRATSRSPQSLGRERQDEATSNNEAAFSRFMARHGSGPGYRLSAVRSDPKELPFGGGGGGG